MPRATSLWKTDTPMPENPAWNPAAETQLAAEFAAFHASALRFGYSAADKKTPSQIVTSLITALRGDRNDFGLWAAEDIANSLGHHPFSWWGTPLGHACVWHIGYYTTKPPAEVITAIFGFSRQHHCDIRARREAAGLVRTLSSIDVRDAFRARWAAEMADDVSTENSLMALLSR